jgi:hypothetical protein
VLILTPTIRTRSRSIGGSAAAAVLVHAVMARTLTIAAVLKAPFGLASEASRFAWESLATTAAVGVLLASGERDRIRVSAGRSLAVSVDP